jgi:hypothetical protein
VRQLAVVAERFAVIARRRHDQAAGGAGLRGGDHAAQARVGGGDLAVVGTPALLLAIGRGRIVGRVRLVEVHPGEERPRLVADPLLRGRGHDRTRALGFEHARARGAALDAIVVEVEPAGQAEAPVEDVGGDEGRRRVSAALQHRGQGGGVRGEDRAAVEVHAVMRRLPAAEDRGVRRERERHRSQRLLEHGPA